MGRSTPTPPASPLGVEARKKIVQKFMRIMRTINPDPKCELYYKTHFQLLVSVILSAQTTDKMVNLCMEPLYRQGFTPDDVLIMGEDGLLEKIRRIGLAPTKAKNVFRTAAILKKVHKGRVPKTRAELEALPGVGRKTANVVLGELFQEPTLAVDTHVFRVTSRLGLHKETSPEKCEQALHQVVPPRYLPKGHHWFILHGRYVCTAKAPQCHSCPVRSFCPSQDAS